ncbi:ATP phosphoribosyltransferase [Tepidibacillus decaturensis]|uniref:ATP phosphoribosyltransferase n=1 Tax=Tepidibacillus decaturensis TaxID=1413211 RepID=A0A135L667_9BACI|nr:ATP phosphoribosyltransferase [Tepidibacillus decaturensis]KXG44399.1 ATP phosphoribosyltransferase [Tepidibacillus decaturensis]
MKRDILTIAMPKGRIMEEAMEIWQKARLPIPFDLEDTRKLILTIEGEAVEWILAKPMDVPTYVEYGVADIGIVGKDVLMETEREVYELLDLKISPCRLSVAGLPQTINHEIVPRIASKYPRVAEKYFREQGKQVEVVQLHGSVELGPIIGLADRIVDIVSTGRTLKENGLVEMETIAHITTRLIANQVSYRMKQEKIKEIIERLSEVI